MPSKTHQGERASAHVSTDKLHWSGPKGLEGGVGQWFDESLLVHGYSALESRLTCVALQEMGQVCHSADGTETGYRVAHLH